MTERGSTYQIYGTYVEHKGRFAQAVAYHPIDRNLHHVFEFEADYAIKTEISAEARIMLGSKVIDTKGGSNDFYGIGTCVREVARDMKQILADYAGATVLIVAKIEVAPCILAPVENPEHRRKYTNMPNDWYMAEDKDKLTAMVNSGRASIPVEEFPRRLQYLNEDNVEELVVWDSTKPTDFSALIAFASRFNLSAEKLDSILEHLR